MGARVGNYLLFAGGYGIQDGGGYGDMYYTFNLVDAYNTSLVKTTATALTARVRHGGKYGHGNTWYAIFSVGGDATLNLYNASLVRTTLVTTANKAPVGMATFENFTIMVAANTNTVEVLDNLTLLKFPGDPLPANTRADSCVTLGTAILVAGNNIVYALT